MKKPLIIAIYCAVLLTSAPGYACRVPVPAYVRIRALAATTIILAEIEDAAYTYPAAERDRQWRGVALVKRTLLGEQAQSRFEVSRSGSSAACDDGIPPPSRGDFWVLYLKDVQGSVGPALLAYPLLLARRADPNLNALIGSASGVR